MSLAHAVSGDEFVTQAAEVLRDPAAFSRTFLGGDPWAGQATIMRAVAEHSRVAVKACHSSGKTHCAAEIVLWWLARYPDGQVITTAPTWVQVEKLLWRKIHSAVNRAAWPFPKANKTELTIGPENYAVGLSTNDGDRFQGFHGRILIVVDEAPGVRASIFSAIDGIRAGGDVTVLLIGNPTVASGYFYKAFTGGNWKTFTIDSFDTPNLEGVTEEDIAALPVLEDDWSQEQAAFMDIAPKPYLTTRRWVWEMYHEHGKSSAYYQSRVRGKFPTESEDQLFPLGMVEQARLSEGVKPGLPIEGAIDVAGPGKNETVLYTRAGEMITSMRAWTMADPKGALQMVLSRKEFEGITAKVDAVGIGYHVWRHLNRSGLNAVPVYASAASSNPKRFLNKKSEVYWEFRNLLREGLVNGLTDETTVGQLLGIRYEHDLRGRIRIRSKRLDSHSKSPDRAEALIWCFASNVASPLTCY